MRVRSWFGAAGAVAARRDWELHDAATGARLGAATSIWLPFSLETRRMIRLPPELRTFFLERSPQPPRCVRRARAQRSRLTVAPAAAAAGRWARPLRRPSAWRCRLTRRPARRSACGVLTWT